MKMKNRLKKHTLKFIAVFLSFFLWVYVLNSEKVKFEKTVTLEYILPEDMVFARKPVREVTFLIEGPRAFVRTVSEREDRLVLDLNKANTKRQLDFQVDINPTQLNLPFGMVVERVLPRKISIKLEKKASKKVPVKLQTVGLLPERLLLQDVGIKPDEVEVFGPRSQISKLKELPTRPVDLENLVGKESLPVEVQLPDDRFSLASMDKLELTYKLRPAGSNLTLTKVPIRFLTHSKQVMTKNSTVTLKLLVPEQVLKNRSSVSSSVQVWADVPEKARGEVRVPLRTILPPGFHQVEIIPKSIIVDIQ
jgi:YbbR domain-containing protein